MGGKNEVGKAAEKIAFIIWCELEAVDIETDKQGTDAYSYGVPVQIKGDKKIAISNNLYLQIYKKTFDSPNLNFPVLDWRISPCNSDLYIFVTDKFAVRIYKSELHKAVEGLQLEMKTISQTSRGYLIPIKKLPKYELKEHPWVLTRPEDIPTPVYWNRPK